MIRIHPHWENIDDVPVHQAHTPARVAVVASPGSRSSAAIVGIFAFLLLGYFLYMQTDSLGAQLAEEQGDIHINANGIAPLQSIVSPAAEITWINDDTKPHILSSDTLETTEGLLYTAAIFPGESHTISLADSLSSGQYDYISLTDPEIHGSILVETNIPSSPETTLPPPVNDLPPPVEPAPPLPSVEVSPTPSSPVAINPNALGANPPLGTPSPTTQVTSYAKPFRQPETGAPTWITGVLGLGVIAYMMRRVSIS